MNRGTCAVFALLLATPSLAWAQREDAKTGKPAATHKAADAKAKTKSAAAEKSGDASTTKPTTRRRSKAKEEDTGPSPQARSLARRTKSIYIFAADSCERAGPRCDPTLRDDAELRFMDACGACNTAARCEEERDAVRAGKAKASRDPCAP